MKSYQLVLLGTAILIGAFLAGRYSSPAKVVTEETQQTKTNQTRDQDVVETTKETRSPDGTVVKETRKEKQTSVQTQQESQKSFTKTVENRPDYRLGVLYEPPIKGFQTDVYTLSLEHRLFSEFYVGVSVSSKKMLGLVFSLGF